MSGPVIQVATGPRYLPGARVLTELPEWVRSSWTYARQSAESELTLSGDITMVSDLSVLQPGRFLRQYHRGEVREWIVDGRETGFTRGGQEQFSVRCVPIHHLLRWAPIRRQRAEWPADTSVAAVNMTPREMIGSFVVPTMAAWGYDIFRTGLQQVAERVTVGLDAWTPLELLQWMAQQFEVAWNLRPDDAAGVYRIDFGHDIDRDVDFRALLTDAGALLEFSTSEDLDEVHTAVLARGGIPEGSSQPATIAQAVARVTAVSTVGPETTLELEMLDGAGPVLLEDGQLVGRWVVGPTGATHQITGTDAPGTVRVAATAALVAGDLVQFAETANRAGISLLESPTGLERLGAPAHLVGVMDTEERGERQWVPDPYFRGLAGNPGSEWFLGLREPQPGRIRTPIDGGTPTVLTSTWVGTHLTVSQQIVLEAIMVDRVGGGTTIEVGLWSGHGTSGSPLYSTVITMAAGVGRRDLVLPAAQTLAPGQYTVAVRQNGAVAAPEIRIITTGLAYPYLTARSTGQIVRVDGDTGSGLGPRWCRITMTTVISNWVVGLPGNQTYPAGTMIAWEVNRADLVGSPQETRVMFLPSAITTDGSGILSLPHINAQDSLGIELGGRTLVSVFLPSSPPGMAGELRAGPTTTLRGTFPWSTRPASSMGRPTFPLTVGPLGVFVAANRIQFTGVPAGTEVWPGDQLFGQGGAVPFRATVWEHAVEANGVLTVRCIHWHRNDVLGPNATVQVRPPARHALQTIGDTVVVWAYSRIRVDFATGAVVPIEVPFFRTAPALPRLPSTSAQGVLMLSGVSQANGPAAIGPSAVLRVRDQATNAQLAEVTAPLQLAGPNSGSSTHFRVPVSWSQSSGRLAQLSTGIAAEIGCQYLAGFLGFVTLDIDIPEVEGSHANRLWTRAQRRLQAARYGAIRPRGTVREITRAWGLPTDDGTRLVPGARVLVEAPSVGIREVFVVERIDGDPDSEDAVVEFGARRNRFSRQVTPPGRQFVGVLYDLDVARQTYEVGRTQPVQGLPAVSRPHAEWPEQGNPDDPSPDEVVLSYG